MSCPFPHLSMQSQRNPNGCDRRLVDLGLVDGHDDHVFDRLTALARRRLNVPAAFMTIVEPELDRQVFKSVSAPGTPFQSARMLPLSHSFCKIVCASNAPLVVLDAASDSRVRSNRAISDYGVGAYLGCPIHFPDGTPLGALCVIDWKRRDWSAAQLAEMQRLAGLVSLAVSFGDLVAELDTASEPTADPASDTMPVIRVVAPDSAGPPPASVCRRVACGEAAAGRPEACIPRPALVPPGENSEAILAGALWQGIAAGEFLPWFQPQIGATSGKVIGAEAVARWCRKDGRVALPDAFLPLAERMGILNRIDRQIIRHATRTFEGLPRDLTAGLQLSVNMTLDALLDRTIVDILTEHRAAGHAVSVELLESIALETPDAARDAQLGLLREAGIRIGLDDFGSNRSSILALLRVRPDYVKIDRRLVDTLCETDRDGRALSAIVTLARQTGAQVVAEGIETEAQARIATDLGCDVLQGYHFARPMDAEALAWLLSEGPMFPRSREG